MTLPTIDVPTYDLTIPSTKNVIKVRPFTVKEEKLLLISLESKEADDIIKTVKQVITNCIIDAGKNFDINKAPFFDVDYIFIFLRAKSIGNTVQVKMTCNNEVEDNICGNIFSADMDISKCEIINDAGVSNDIKLDGDKGVKMKYPNYSQMKQIELGNQVDIKINTVINSIDYIYDKDQMYSSKDHSKTELKQFVESMIEEKFRKLEAFIDNFPTFAVVLEKKCNKCGFEHSVRYTDFYDFFF